MFYSKGSNIDDCTFSVTKTRLQTVKEQRCAMLHPREAFYSETHVFAHECSFDV